MTYLDRKIDHANPDTVFRYRPITANSLYEISTSSFYLSKPSDFNDPYDCDFYWKNHSLNDIEEHIFLCGSESNETNIKELGAAKSQFENDLHREVDDLGVTCFTTDPCNPLMWSHYADGHKGICIEYKREGILRDEDFRKVEYDRDDKLVWSSLEIAKDLDSLYRFFSDVVFSKLPDWKYEKEWRYMAIRPTERLFHMSSPVSSVTFGLKCPKKEFDKVLNIIRLHYFSGATKIYIMKRSQSGTLVPQELKPDGVRANLL